MSYSITNVIYWCKHKRFCRAHSLLIHAKFPFSVAELGLISVKLTPNTFTIGSTNVFVVVVFFFFLLNYLLAYSVHRIKFNWVHMNRCSIFGENGQDLDASLYSLLLLLKLLLLLPFILLCLYCGVFKSILLLIGWTPVNPVNSAEVYFVMVFCHLLVK